MKKSVLFLCVVVLMAVCVLPTAAASAGTATLAGKKGLFVGDSIAAGWRDTGYGHTDYSASGGWSLRMQKNYQMQVTHAAYPGQSFTVIERRGHIVEQLHNNKSGSYDYVILQGGFNDCMGENTPGNNNMAAIPKLGTVSTSFKVGDFDTTTFSGSFEELLYYAKTYFPTAKIGFIVTYQTPLSAYGGITNGVRKTLEGYTQADYIKRQMELCDKWKIPYLNLWDGIAPDGKKFSGDIIDVDADGVHFPGGSDNIHLNTAGYDAITPYIAQWMAQLAGGNAATTTTKATTKATTTTAKTPVIGNGTTTTAKTPVIGNGTTTTAKTPVIGNNTTMVEDTAATATESKEAVTTIVTRPTQETVTETSGDNSTTVTVILICVIAAVLLTVGAVVAVWLIQRRKST